MDQEVYKILVADDSLLNREILCRMLASDESPYVDLKSAQLHVITAVTGHEALEKAMEEKPDLILLDIVMPGLNGFEVLEQLKKTDAMNNVPVIVISGLTDEEDEEKGLSLGAVDYITKPFKKAIVMARIRTHLKVVQQMRLIERLSYFDSLTGIPNRRSFDSYMTNEWKKAHRENSPLSLLMADVDNFKLCNDKYGHPQGDEVLKKLSAEMVSVLKRPSDLVARWGGEEFAVLLPNTGLPGARHVAERMRAQIENIEIPNITGKGDAAPIRVTVSIGVAAMLPTNEKSILELVEQADRALYAAKEAGRNKVSFIDDNILERV